VPLKNEVGQPKQDWDEHNKDGMLKVCHGRKETIKKRASNQ
jgi:hypothetical protein